MEPLRRYSQTNVSYGWPTLGSMLGRVMLVWLDDVFNYGDRLSCVTDDPASEHLALFIAQAHRFASYSAVQVFRQLQLEVAEFAPAVHHGLITRSLTTTAGYSFRKRDTARYTLSLELGLHVLSSDFEAPCAGNVRVRGNVTAAGAWGEQVQVEGWKDANQYDAWCERLPTGWPFECHPILAPAWCVHELDRVRREGVERAVAGNSTAGALGYWDRVNYIEVPG